MRKCLIMVIAIVAGLSSLSMYHDPSTDILDGHDYERMRTDASQGPALNGPLINGDYSWASYDQRLCFPARDMNISCTEVEYGEVRKVPTLHVTQDSHYFEFSMDPEPAPDCHRVVDRWKALLQDEKPVCVYAAPLQELDISDIDTNAEAGSLWIVNQLKTAKGYWHFESDENWLREDNGGDSARDDAEAADTDSED